MDALERLLNERFDLEQVHNVDSIEPAVCCMEELGNPQDSFYSFHVAGTNGKGSTCTFLARALEAAGLDVGLFIHPPLTDYRERFRINGELIDRDRLLEIAERVADAGEPSSYEFSTGIAFQYFAEEAVDVAVIETGMGGRLDATNTIDADVNVITPIGRDHSDVLGETIEEIAGEKAAIIDEGSQVVSNAGEAADSVVRSYASRRDAVYHEPQKVVDLQGEGLFLDALYGDEIIETQIVALYQEDNINTAIRALQVSAFDVSDAAITSALRDFSLDGRMQELSKSPRVLADGAHNASGMEVSCDAIDRLDQENVAVFGVMEDKEYEIMLERLHASVDAIVLTEPSPDRAADPNELVNLCSIPVSVVPEPLKALDQAKKDTDGSVFVTGSLYLIGDLIEGHV